MAVQKDRYKFSMKPGIPLVQLAYLCAASGARNTGLHYSPKAVVTLCLYLPSRSLGGL